MPLGEIMTPNSIVGVDRISPLAPAAYRIRAVIDGLDQVAHAMERKWGIERLRLLVSDQLRSRFDEQRDRLDAALAGDREADVRVHAEAMQRAWVLLDRTASESGCSPLAPEVWECVLPGGEVVSLVRTEPEACHVGGDGRVFTVGEIAALIAKSDDTLGVPTKRPVGAVPAPKSIDWERGDDIPF